MKSPEAAYQKSHLLCKQLIIVNFAYILSEHRTLFHTLT